MAEGAAVTVTCAEPTTYLCDLADRGMITVRRRDITPADLIVTDRLAPVAVLTELAPHAHIVDVSKIRGGRRTEQRQINALLIEHALAGRTVVRLKAGTASSSVAAARRSTNVCGPACPWT